MVQLTPGRYVGAATAEDDGEPFEEKMKRLAATLRQQQTEASTLDAPGSGAVTMLPEKVVNRPRTFDTIR